MKKYVETYVEPLTFLINMSITQCIFANELKIARVIRWVIQEVKESLNKPCNHHPGEESNQSFRHRKIRSWYFFMSEKSIRYC